MTDRVYCYGINNGRTCERATQCQRWTELQQLRHTDAEPLKVEPLLCDASWLSHVPLEERAA